MTNPIPAPIIEAVAPAIVDLSVSMCRQAIDAGLSDAGGDWKKAREDAIREIVAGDPPLLDLPEGNRLVTDIFLGWILIQPHTPTADCWSRLRCLLESRIRAELASS